MKINQKHFLEHLVMFFIMGALYVCVEFAYRGYSHWTMILVGGLAGFVIGELNCRHFSWDMAVLSQCIIGSIITTIIEFVSGCIINLWLGWNVWDYSLLPYNALGQICLLFSVFWIVISFPTILLDDWLRFKLFGEEIEGYKWL